MDTPELDLTEATEAAARKWWEAVFPDGPAWCDLLSITRHGYLEQAVVLVAAAAPSIARQAWEVGYHDGWCDADATYQRPNPWRDKS